MSKSQRLPLWDLIRNPECKLCPLHETAQTVCLIGDGKYPADLMLVGEAPGDREDSPNIRKPFQGRAGQLLDTILEALEIPRSDIFITNAVHCHPPENQKPTPNEISTCSGKYLRREISKVKPKLIVALGAVAAQGLMGQKMGVAESRNKIWKTKEPFLETNFIVTYHPAAVLRNDDLLKHLIKDMEWAQELLSNGVQDEKVQYKQIESISEIPGIEKAKWVSLDLETDGFDPFLPNRKIISVQLAIKPGFAYYLRWTPEVKEEIKGICENPNIGKVGHNINKFDRKWLRKEEIKLRGRVHDTLIGIHLQDENFADKSLDVVASEFTPLKAHKTELKEFRKKNRDVDFRDYPLSIMIPYGCGDADAALRLKDVQIPVLEEQELMPLFNMEMKAMKMFSDMEYTGAKIDVRLIDELADIYEKRIAKLDIALKGVNAKSSKQVCKILYEKWKLPAMGVPTKKSNWKPPANSAEKTLIRLMEAGVEPNQETFIRRVLRSRELRTQLSTYVLGISDYLREGDFVHPNYLLHGTVTGRPSCRDPNLANIPREGDIKRLFISRFGKRGVIMQVDVSQGELRLAAHRSEDPGLLEAFRQGGIDIHRKVASDVLGIPPEEVTDEQRKKAKIINFGILYGGGISKMAFEMKTSEKEAYEFMERWQRTYSRWRPFVRGVHKEVLRTGYVVSDFKRRRRLPISNPTSEQGKEALRQAVNSPIQGGLSDLNKLCGLKVRDRARKEGLKEVHFFANVYDSWVLDTLEDNIPALSRIFQETYKDPDVTKEFGFRFKVPIDISISVGPNWYEQKEIYPEEE